MGMNETLIQYRPRDFVHRIVTPKNCMPDAAAWCQQQFGPRWSVTGPRSGRWSCFWRGFKSEYPGQYEWLFVDRGDAVLFALKWL